MSVATGSRHYVSKRKYKIIDDALCTHIHAQPTTDAERERLQGAARAQVPLSIRPTYCPRCSQLLQQEPAFAYCRWGCTRVFPIVGASYVEQYEYERMHGLVEAYASA